MVTLLSKRSCKLDDAQDGAMLEWPLIILNPNRPHCCQYPAPLFCHARVQPIQVAAAQNTLTFKTTQ